MRAALGGRPGTRYVELAMFEHATPRRLGGLRLVRELARFVGFLYPVFRQTQG